jgi:ankyrin repeat protein
MLAGMEIETKGTNGVTPLLAAVFGNNPAIVKELLELGADVLARESESEATSLHYAASGDPLKMMQGGGVSAPTREEVMEFSGIHYEEVNAAAIARLLLEYGADIEARDFAQQTPLFVAAKSGSLEVAKLLLSQGADIEARDGFQATPFMISVLGNNLELMKLLQENGADIHAVDERGANATWGAVANIKPELLDYTLAQGVSIDIDSKELLPTLHAACGQVIHEGNKADVAKIIKLLLEHGADPNSRDRMLNITPLHGAAQAANPEAIQLLLEYGASVNEIGHSVKATPLHMAASSACVECVKLLLDNGADPGIKDGDGNLPVQIAGAGREQVRKDKAQLEEDLSLSNSQMTKEDRRFFEEKAAAYEEIIRLLESV